jgi:hypothetical protein
MTVRGLIGAYLVTLSLSLSLALLSTSASASQSPPASTGTPYVDGISDQSIPTWDGAAGWDGGFSGSYFARLFHEAWVGSPPSHITLARYVVQWNAIAESEQGKPDYLRRFESWLRDVAGIGLIPDLALTSYTGEYPSSPGDYQAQLRELLDRAQAIGHPIRYLEAWNEPNNQGNESALNAADFTNSASATCGEDSYSCVVIAGNFEDSPDVASYELQYIENLDPVPSIWGVHPYYSVEEEREAPFQNVREHLPNRGVGEQIWFTEISARECSDFDGHLLDNGELGQAQRADWLVNTLMRNAKPAHVFYYEFLLGERRRPSCLTEGSDGALYLPSADRSTPDRPRLAAGYIWDGGSDGGSALWGFPGGAFAANAEATLLTGGV